MEQTVAHHSRSHARGRPHHSVAKAYGFVWVTTGFFLISFIGHWLFGWFAFVEEQRAHGEAVQVSNYLVEMSRDTLENWQSEFLQLIWQVGGLAFLLYLGSPQSKEGDDRKEEKLDAILMRLDPEHGKEVISKLDRKYPRKA
jgi:hypothetical protein